MIYSINLNRMKKLFILVGLLMATVCSWAQCGFVSVSYEDPISGSSANIGQLFTKAFTDNGYASEGLQQSFLYRGEEIAFVSANDVPYAFREGRQPAAIPATLDFGFTDVYLLPIYGIDSLLTLFVTNCTVDPVEDYDGNSYNTVLLDYKCWTKENLRSLHYMQDGSEIANPMVYVSEQNPDESANLDIYGRLFNWYAAVKVAEGSKDAPEADTEGIVQGICPNGWHVPSAVEMQTLANHTSAPLRTTNLWLVPGTNTTDFSLLPSGFFNSMNGRFENMGGEAFLWTSTPTTPNTICYTGYSSCWCNEFQVITANSSHGYSVRCVQN